MLLNSENFSIRVGPWVRLAKGRREKKKCVGWELPINCPFSFDESSLIICAVDWRYCCYPCIILVRISKEKQTWKQKIYIKGLSPEHPNWHQFHQTDRKAQDRIAE